MTSIPFDAAVGRADPGSRVADTADIAAGAGAWAVLLGTVVTVVGISWDIQWHNEVGPDTFFTLPHLFLYSGSAISGFASLAMVVRATAAQRAGRPVPWAGGVPVRVFGSTLTAPLGYMVSGAGAALFLLYGLFDLRWHAIYGFDAVLNTPSHVALFLSISTTMIGSLIVFASHLGKLWGRIGFVVALVILMAFAPVSADALNNLSLPINAVVAGAVLFAPLLLIVGAVVLARPWAAIWIAVAMGVQQGGLWWFSPWAAHTYAAAIGLPLRDGLPPRPPTFPAMMPMFLIVSAVLAELLLRRARARGTDLRTPLLLFGPISGVLTALGLVLQRSLTDSLAHTGASATAILALLGIPLGLIAGFFGGRLAAMLRSTAPTGEGA
ncbi:hypothetical protein [Nocardia sp. alder85J]|uniref:hypothetical protein n=1 Tax=Nocardia sp. alder85J TaxID=2862949 RepID=UPI001CD416B0|nr:hypothetical protein [Nocardia sp. alder85J]MCX4098239.1 hypothetical protein [Nocardia sp. alder85J]